MVHARSTRAIVCLSAFLMGLVATSMAPLQAASPPPAIPSGWDTSQQLGGGSLLPNVIGGVTGLAIGGATFGVVGAMAGVVGGWALGSVVENQLFPAKHPVGYPTLVNRSLLANLIPGLAGAVLGSVAVWGMGPLAIIVGGMTGFFLGRALARVMFPQVYYGAPVYPQAQRTVGHGTSPSVGGAFVHPRTSTAPSAPGSTQEQSLAELRAAFYASAGVYRRALETGSQEEQLEARDAYREAQERFLDARRAAGGLR